jgi:hypothetical protein
MSKRKRSPAPNKCHSDNPIIAAVLPSLQGKVLVPVAGDWENRYPSYILRESVRITFDESAITEVGRLVCLSLLTGDRRMIKTVRDALKESDHLFNRDRQPGLAKDVMTYLPSLWQSGLDIVAIKKEIEKRSNDGEPLKQHQWNRLRRAIDLPKRPTGRPVNSGTKRR